MHETKFEKESWNFFRETYDSFFEIYYWFLFSFPSFHMGMTSFVHAETEQEFSSKIMMKKSAEQYGKRLLSSSQFLAASMI